MGSKLLHIWHGACGHVAILRLSGLITEHAHSEAHLQFWLGGAPSLLKVGGRVVSRDNRRAIAINPFEAHAVIDKTDNQDSLCMLFYLNNDWVDDRCHSLGVSPSFESSSIIVNSFQRQLIKKIQYQMSVENAHRDTERNIDALFNNIMLGSKQGRTEKFFCKEPHQRPDFRIQKSVDFMQENLDVRFSFDEVAKASGLSRTRFFHLFRRHMNVKPSVFWNTIRMEVAIEKLAQTDTSLINLSYTLGFTDPANFSRFFRNHFGVSPSQYRSVAVNNLTASTTN